MIVQNVQEFIIYLDNGGQPFEIGKLEALTKLDLPDTARRGGMM